MAGRLSPDNSDFVASSVGPTGRIFHPSECEIFGLIPASLNRGNSSFWSVRRGVLALLLGLLAVGLPAQQQVDLATVQARAEAGDTEAQNVLGNLYTSGTGVAVNYATALDWYQKAAERGFAAAQFNLGLVYELGRGVAVDERRAFRYYLLAAEQGFPAAQFNVGNMYATGRGVGQDFFESNLWFRQAADKGVTEAQYNLGLAYESGRGVLRDDGQAARWFKLAADRGFALAQYRLGLMCEEARGVEKNLTAAVALYRAAAEQGYAPAQTNLGLLHASGGGGLTADPVQGLAWMSLAVENGESPQGRDSLAQKLTPAQQAGAAKALADLRARFNPATPPALSAQPAAAGTAAPNPTDQSYVDGLEDLVAKLRDANDQLGQANQRLALDKAQLEQRQGGDAAQAKLIEDLRAQSGRLAGLNQQLIAEKEGATRELGVLNGRLQDAEQEAARLRQAAASEPAEKAISSAAPAASDGAEVSRLAAQLAERDTRLRNLQRDNERLNDDVKRSTRELLSLNSQLRSLNEQLAKSGPGQPAAGSAADTAALTGLKQENSRLARVAAEAQQQVRQLESEKAALQQTADNLQKSLREKPAAGSGDSVELAEARQKLAQVEKQAAESAQRLERQLQDARVAAARLEEEVRALQDAQKSAAAVAAALASERARVTELSGEVENLQGRVTAAEQQVQQLESDKTALAESAQRLEQALQERATSRTAGPDTLADLRQKLDRAEKQALAAGRLERQLQEAREEASRLEVENRSLQDVRKTAGPAASQLAAARARVTELTGEVENLQARLVVAEIKSGRATTDDAALDRLRQELAGANSALEKSGAAVAELTGENDRLEGELAAAGGQIKAAEAAREQTRQLQIAVLELPRLREEITRLNRENQQLKSDAGDNRDLVAARREIARLENRLNEANEAGPRETVDSEGVKKLQAEVAEAGETIDKLNAQVAELTGINDRLERDLESAKKGTEAALAAQQQAVTAAQPDAYQMEIRTLQERVKQLEGTLADDRTNSARDLAALASQLQKAREANQALNEANRALMAVRQSDDAPSRAEFDEAQAKARDLTAVGDELRRQVQQLTDAKAAAEEQAAKLSADLAALQAKFADTEQAAEAHGSSVAELTGENEQLARERDTLRAENQRLARTTQSAEQQRLEAERSASLNVNAMAAQLAELRRDLDNVRGTNARLLESNTALERERTTTMAQLRGENAALQARLAQAQSTLDQIASAARLGTPASQIAAGAPAPVSTQPIPATASEPRYHVVAEGDSLSRISLRYYGTAGRWQEIYEANRDELRGANTLRLGQRLRIP